MSFRQMTSFFIIILLLCGICPISLMARSGPLSPEISNAAEDVHVNAGIAGCSAASRDIYTGSGSGLKGLPVSADGCMSTCGMPDGNGYDPLPAGFNCTGSAIYFTLPDALSNTYEMDCGDTGFSQLQSNLDPVSIYGVLEKEGVCYSVYLPVEWDFSTVDAENPGSYTALGNISLPSGAALAEGLESTIYISVMVKSPPDIPSQPAKVVLTGFDEQYRMDAAAFALGVSQEELSEWFAWYCDGFTGYDPQGNVYDLMTGTWSLEDVDPNTPGVYYAWAPPDLGDDYVLGDGIPMPRLLFAVTVQDPDKPDINCCVSARGFLLFPWVLSTELQDQLDQFSVWMRRDEGTWELLDENSCMVISDGLYLSQRALELGNTYGLQVSYPGGQTGILTFRYDDMLTIIDYSGGDRDGGDVGGAGPSTGTQPAPDPVQTPGSSDDDDGDSSSNDGGDDPAQDALPSPKPNGTQTTAPDEAPEDSSHVPDETQSPPPIESTQETIPPSQEQLLPVSYPVSSKPPKPEPIQSASEPSSTAAKLTENMSESSAAVTGRISGSLQDADIAPEPKQYDSVSSFQTQDLPEGRGITKTANGSQNDKGVQTEAGVKPQETDSTVQESYSPTQTVISGLRLSDLCTGEKNVIFGASSLTVSIPSELLLALKLTDTDTLSVELTQPEQNKVTLNVVAFGSAVTKLPGTILRLRYAPQSESSDITVWNETGTKSSDTDFDGEYLCFTVDTAGTYTIMETGVVPEGSQSARSSALPLVLAVFASLLPAAGIAVLIRRR